MYSKSMILLTLEQIAQGKAQGWKETRFTDEEALGRIDLNALEMASQNEGEFIELYFFHCRTADEKYISSVLLISDDIKLLEHESWDNSGYAIAQKLFNDLFSLKIL